MTDGFGNTKINLESPCRKHYAITPNDSADLPRRPRCLRVQTAGTLTMIDEDGASITYSVVAGETIPFRPVRVMLTGTTATVVGWE